MGPFFEDSNESSLIEIDTESESDFTDGIASIDDNFDYSDGIIGEASVRDLSTSPLTKKSESSVWTHFGKLTRNGREIVKCGKSIFCKLCFADKVFKRYGQTLDTMRISVHFIWCCFSLSYSIKTSLTIVSSHLANVHNIFIASASKVENQNKLTEMFFGPPAKRQRVDSESQSMHSMNRRMALWLCCDLLPFSIVEKRGFNDFWNECQFTRNKIPSRTTVSGSALDETYLCFKTRLIQVLTFAPTFGTITTDFWKDKYKQMSYITYTYHFIDNWKINSYVLKTCAFDQSATAENIITHYENTLTDLKLTNKKVIFVTDGGSNLKKACRLMNVIRLDCIAHKIHLLITKDLVQHESMKNFFQVFLEKMHKVHYALLFKYRELKMYDNEERQRKFNDAVNEAADMGDYSLFCLLISFNLFRFGIMLCWVLQKKYSMQSSATN